MPPTTYPKRTLDRATLAFILSLTASGSRSAEGGPVPALRAELSKYGIQINNLPELFEEGLDLGFRVKGPLQGKAGSEQDLARIAMDHVLKRAGIPEVVFHLAPWFRWEPYTLKDGERVSLSGDVCDECSAPMFSTWNGLECTESENEGTTPVHLGESTAVIF